MKITVLMTIVVVLLSTDSFAQNRSSQVRRLGNYAKANGPRFVRNAVNGMLVDQLVGQPLKKRYENRGYYVPKKPLIVPGHLSPVFYTAARAKYAY